MLLPATRFPFLGFRGCFHLILGVAVPSPFPMKGLVSSSSVLGEALKQTNGGCALGQGEARAAGEGGGLRAGGVEGREL